MARTYIVGTIALIFEDDNNTIIHQNEFDLDNSGQLASFVIGSRIELFDDGKQLIGSIKDVKHRISADSSNNYTDSVTVRCGQSYVVS
ncbi:hypothetical protein [Ruegeria arenilitoris]|uniref:hypothetical protein n=1 Tax=Ruegeria arenilitoris TaxID=1173585 RepID=UPI001CFEF508|nr:hypothetical protein [Ruegeria arenilitoris]